MLIIIRKILLICNKTYTVKSIGLGFEFHSGQYTVIS